MKTHLNRLLLVLGIVLGLAELAPPAMAQAIKAATETTSTVTATNSFVAAARPVRAFDITVYNSSTSDLYCHIFDATSTPSAGAVPIAPLKIPTGETRSYTWNLAGRKFTNGVLVATSTTPVTFTNGTASFLIDVTWSP